MSDDMQGLTRIDGWFSCPGSGGDWQMWRNNDGFIELYRTKKVEYTPVEQEDGTTKMVRTYHSGLERKVTFAREPNDLFAYFSKRTSRHKQGRDPGPDRPVRRGRETDSTTGAP